MSEQRGGTRDGDGRDRAFSEYYAARGTSMRATAYLLCGDWHLAEDLVQNAFTKLYLAWRRVSRHEVLDAYLRQTLVRAFLDERRRPWRREQAVAGAEVFETATAPGPRAEDRIVLLRALEQVPPRQRAVLVLRFWEDLSVDETAEAMGCSSGTVKSQSARGLQTLRNLLGSSRVGIEV